MFCICSDSELELQRVTVLLLLKISLDYVL